MGFELGILLALGALACWGFGDYLIQRSAKAFGVWETLLFISAIGVAMLFPFVYGDLHALFAADSTMFALLAVSAIFFIMSLLDFQALKKGKLSIVEPMLAIEVPITAVLSFFVLSEALDAATIMLVSALVIGLILVSIKAHHLSARKHKNGSAPRFSRLFEKGVFLGAAAAFFMGLANFMVGFTARIATPLLTTWFIALFLTVACLFYMHTNNRFGRALSHFRTYGSLIVAVGIIDNAAWIFVAIAMTMTPIAIAISISEAYIAFAALLGLALNKETLMRHQKIGLVIALASAIALSAIY